MQLQVVPLGQTTQLVRVLNTDGSPTTPDTTKQDHGQHPLTAYPAAIVTEYGINLSHYTIEYGANLFPGSLPVLRVFETNKTCGGVVVVHGTDHGLHFTQIHGAITLVGNSAGVDSTQCGDSSLLVEMNVTVGSQNHFTATNLKVPCKSATQAKSTERSTIIRMSDKNE